MQSSEAEKSGGHIDRRHIKELSTEFILVEKITGGDRWIHD